MSKLFLKRKLCNIHTFQLYYYYYSLNSTVCRFVIKEIAGIAEKRLKYDNFFMTPSVTAFNYFSYLNAVKYHKYNCV